MERQEKNIFLTFTIVLSVILSFVAVLLVYNICTYPLKYKDSILKYSSEFNLSPSLVASVINSESGFDKDAVSSKGAVGLMQLKPDTALYMADYLGEKLDTEMLTDSDTNIKLGCCYLDYLFNKFNDEKTALASYNAGEGVVMRWLKNEEYSKDGKTLIKIPYKETENYVKNVISSKSIYENKLNNWQSMSFMYNEISKGNLW